MFKLKEFRNAHSLKQSDLAEVLGLTQSGISRMETEKIELSIVQYQKLYDVYGKEDVDAFRVDSTVVDVNSILNEAQAKGLQQSVELLEIIKKQNDTLCEHVRTQDNFNRTLLMLLEKLSVK